jgi:hypothetical protein
VVTIADRRAKDAARQRRHRQRQIDKLAAARRDVENSQHAVAALKHVHVRLKTLRRMITAERRRSVVDRIRLQALFDFIDGQLDELTTVCDVTEGGSLRHSGPYPMSVIDLVLLNTIGKASTR